jgi:hypothetical protein
MEFPSHLIYSSLRKFHLRITPPLGIPEVGPSFPGNSRVNAPPPLETPRFINRGGGVRIIIDVVVYKSENSAQFTSLNSGRVTVLADTLKHE